MVLTELVHPNAFISPQEIKILNEGICHLKSCTVASNVANCLVDFI